MARPPTARSNTRTRPAFISRFSLVNLESSALLARRLALVRLLEGKFRGHTGTQSPLPRLQLPYRLDRSICRRMASCTGTAGGHTCSAHSSSSLGLPFLKSHSKVFAELSSFHHPADQCSCRDAYRERCRNGQYEVSLEPKAGVI